MMQNLEQSLTYKSNLDNRLSEAANIQEVLFGMGMCNLAGIYHTHAMCAVHVQIFTYDHA